MSKQNTAIVMNGKGIDRIKHSMTRHAGAWLVVLIPALIATPLLAENWPTYRRDNQRSGRTAERIAAKTLQLRWVWRSAHPPQPAWAGPAKGDASNKIRGLRSMRTYDPVFHMIVVDDSLFFGSSVDDAVYNLDTKTGRRRWMFFTDGPIRIAPSYADDRIYFGSDDGHAYCIRADDATLVWKFSPTPRRRDVINNGRFISFWPCRTGVLVDKETAYFANSMLPWDESYLSAVDARTGKPIGPGRYVKRLIEPVTVPQVGLSGTTLEGALLASSEYLIIPQGRVAPRLFQRVDGKPLGILPGGGGCFVLVTDQGQVMHGPGNKTGWIIASDAKTRAQVASFQKGNAMVVAGNQAFVLTNTSLTAFDLAMRKKNWQVECDCPHELILADDILFAGGSDEVSALDSGDGKRLWTGQVRGNAQGLVVANGALFVSTDEGEIYCFRPAEDDEAAVVLSSGTDAVTTHQTVQEKVVETSPTELAIGPYTQFVSTDSAVVHWQTSGLSPTILEYRLNGPVHRIEHPELKTNHAVTLTGLQRNPLTLSMDSAERKPRGGVYRYAIETLLDGHRAKTEEFEIDMFYNYSVPGVPDGPSPYPSDAVARMISQTADHILAETGMSRGICLVLGCGRGQLVYELAKRSQLRVIGVETNPAKVATARRLLQRTGVYGARATVRRIDSLSDLSSFSGQFANLIVSNHMLRTGQCEGSATEVFQLLCPGGGVAYFGQPKGKATKLFEPDLRAWLAPLGESFQIRRDDQGVWARLERPALASSGEWSHQYGRADNASFGGETLQGATSISDMEVQWIGRPGPRFKTDRTGRKPSPLSTNGRFFIQGMQRILAADAYNGTILWSLEIPHLGRYNMPRDCGNWCADNNSVFTTVGDKCWGIDADNGSVGRVYNIVRGPRKDWEYQWGYVARVGNKLVGSAVKHGSAYTDFSAWYDGTNSPKVCSENLFALDKDSGNVAWSYSKGVIINSTITIGDDRVYFVVSRNAKVKASSSRRVRMHELWQDQFLVALDANSGRNLWERPLETVPGLAAFYGAYGSGTLVLVSSGGPNKFYVYAHNVSNGEARWHTSLDWSKPNKAGHMSTPAIINDTLVVRPWVLDLTTGERRKPLAIAMPMANGGCGSYAATTNVLLYRNNGLTMWDQTSGKVSTWDRLRPDCWISAVPACGMVLAAEGGGGCSCGGWMQTTVGFMPLAPR